MKHFLPIFWTIDGVSTVWHHAHYQLWPLQLKFLFLVSIRWFRCMWATLKWLLYKEINFIVFWLFYKSILIMGWLSLHFTIIICCNPTCISKIHSASQCRYLNASINFNFLHLFSEIICVQLNWPQAVPLNNPW